MNIPLIVAVAVVVFGVFFTTPPFNALKFDEFVTHKREFGIEDAIHLSEDQWRPKKNTVLRYPKIDHEYRWTRVQLNPNPSAITRLQTSLLDVFIETIDYFLVENGRVIDMAQSGYNRSHKSNYLPVTQGFRFSTSPTAFRTLYVRTSAKASIPSRITVNTEADATYNLKTLNIVWVY